MVSHKGNLYVDVKVERVLSTEYQVDSEPVAQVFLAPYIPPKRSNKGRQELAKPVIIRDYKIVGIKQMTINGETYKVMELKKGWGDCFPIALVGLLQGHEK